MHAIYERLLAHVQYPYRYSPEEQVEFLTNRK